MQVRLVRRCGSALSTSLSGLFTGRKRLIPQRRANGGTPGTDIRETPICPLPLCCNTDDEFAYQAPASSPTRSKGPEFNRKGIWISCYDWISAPGTYCRPGFCWGGYSRRFSPFQESAATLRSLRSVARLFTRSERSLRRKGTRRALTPSSRPRSREVMQQDKQKSAQRSCIRAERSRFAPHILVCCRLPNMARHPAALRAGQPARDDPDDSRKS